MWNDIKIVHGKWRYSESYGSVKWVKQDFETDHVGNIDCNNAENW